MHSIVTTFRGAVIKVEVANFCAAMDTLIDQDGYPLEFSRLHNLQFTPLVLELSRYSLISNGDNSAFAHFATAIPNHYNL